MKLVSLFITILLLSFNSTSTAHNIIELKNDPPSSEKATIYIVRPSIVGSAINFRYFLNKHYIGKSKQGTYFKLEIEPGEHILWAKAENYSFLDINVKAGETYVVNAVPAFGFMYSGIELVPVENSEDRLLKRIRKYIAKKKQWEHDISKQKKEQAKVDKFINKSVKKYKKLKSKLAVNRLNQPVDEEKICVCITDGFVAPISNNDLIEK